MERPLRQKVTFWTKARLARIERATSKKGDASKYVELFNIRPGDKVFLYSRVSTKGQEEDGNDKDQEDQLRSKVEEAGGIVVGSLCITMTARGDTSPLMLAVKKAKEASADLILAETLNRLVRNYWYSTSKVHNSFQPSEVDLKEMAEHTQGFRLMTYLDPNATSKDEKSVQIKRGQAAKRNGGGRPRGESKPPEEPKKPGGSAGYMTARRLQWRPEVLKLKAEDPSWNNRKLAEHISKQSGRPVNCTLISDWLTKKFREDSK